MMSFDHHDLAASVDVLVQKTPKHATLLLAITGRDEAAEGWMLETLTAL
jgi:hypothetical protein